LPSVAASTLSLATPFIAQAEEVEQVVTRAAAQGGSPTDILVSVLFTLSAIALLIVTGGVVYLSAKQWQDRADENKLLKSGPLEEPVFAPEPKLDPDELQYVSCSEKTAKYLPSIQHLSLTNV
jgi:hypothetical protein